MFQKKEEYYRAQRAKQGLDVSDAEKIADNMKKSEESSQLVNMVVSAVLLAIVIFVIMLMASGGINAT